jgi:hypothetical protein
MQPTTSPSAESRPRADWARAAEGIQLAGLSVFLLLNTTGVLPWSFWLDAIALWPVLLMSWGLRIAFEKSQAPWLLLFGPVLVLGSLAWVASGSRVDIPLGPWIEETKARPDGANRLKLRAHLAGSRMAVTATDVEPALLARVRTVATPANARVESGIVDDQAQLEVKGGWNRGGFFFLTPWRKQRWDIQVPSNLPLRLDVDGAGAAVMADLRRTGFESGRLGGVFLGLDVQLPAATRQTTIEVHGVFNALKLSVPEGTPVRVRGAGLPFNAIDDGVPGLPGIAGYEVKVNGIFMAVTVHSRPGERAAPPAADQRPERPTAEATPPPGSETRTPAAERPKAEAVPPAR